MTGLSHSQQQQVIKSFERIPNGQQGTLIDNTPLSPRSSSSEDQQAQMKRDCKNDQCKFPNRCLGGHESKRVRELLSAHSKKYPEKWKINDICKIIARQMAEEKTNKRPNEAREWYHYHECKRRYERKAGRWFGFRDIVIKASQKHNDMAKMRQAECNYDIILEGMNSKMKLDPVVKKRLMK